MACCESHDCPNKLEMMIEIMLRRLAQNIRKEDVKIIVQILGARGSTKLFSFGETSGGAWAII